jgi:hypothetical protein
MVLECFLGNAGGSGGIALSADCLTVAPRVDGSIVGEGEGVTSTATNAVDFTVQRDLARGD